MRNLGTKEMKEKYCRDCDHCKRSNGTFYCEKGKCPFVTEDYKYYKENEKK